MSKRTVYRVSELANAARDLLEHSFPLLWVEGEISNLARPRSGHWYFTLKDDTAQIRCAMFANRNRALKAPPADGDQVIVRAKVSLYTARGDFQLIVESLEDAGAGALQRAFEQLRDKLAAEGLFDQEHKRALPALPRRIGVITSATGAALRDVLSVLRRRYPLVRVLVHPVPVQGEAAPAAIVRALTTAGTRGECDVLLLVRGGGSLEDLWAFNDEAVARAIRAAPVPVVAGVGHETDVTIADFAADLRAPTPSAAAELVCPDLGEHLARAAQLRRRGEAALHRRLIDASERHRRLLQRLQRAHPRRRLQQQMQRADELELRLRRALRGRLDNARQRRRSAAATLAAHSPRGLVQQRRQQLRHTQTTLCTAITRVLERAGQRWRLAGRGLNAVSPLQTLARGYAIAEDRQWRVITDADTINAGDGIRVRLHRGRLDCRVESSHSGAIDVRDKVARGSADNRGNFG